MQTYAATDLTPSPQSRPKARAPIACHDSTFLHDLTQVPASCRGAVVMIGNFDGFHRGHRALLAMAQRIARSEGRKVAVLTPDPHPTCFFAPDIPAFQISPGVMKRRLLTEAGVDIAFMPEFNRPFATTTADDFINHILLASLGVAHVVVGYDFRFGAGRKGNVGTLAKHLRQSGRGLSVVDAMSVDGNICSSSRIRDLIRAGRIEDATDLLGAPWRIAQMARIEHFKKPFNEAMRCRITLGDYVRPARGSYGVSLAAGNQTCHATAFVRGDEIEVITTRAPNRHLPALMPVQVTFHT